MRLKIKALLSGLSTFIPGYDRKGSTGGTDSARYCYSVWLRHLSLAERNVPGVASSKVVAELGPGDSIGIGLAALLSGADRYFALDLVPYSTPSKNLEIFDALAALFAARAKIPDDTEFPHLYPKLDCYDFPRHLIADDSLERALAPTRLEAIRACIEGGSAAGSMIAYKAPWNAADVIDEGAVDWIFSQAALEHVDDLQGAYASMRKWLKARGIMTHQIDFKCHGKANEWNGHWTYTDFEWKLIVGRRPYLLNRQPYSVHVGCLERSGFEILNDTIVRTDSRLRKDQLAARFRDLSSDDLTTSGAFIVAVARDTREW